jgi:hypothetical protein
VQGAEPWPALPLTLIGLVLGMLGGWLLTARIGYRVRRLSPWRQMPFVFAATIAIASLGLAVPEVARILIEMLGSVAADPLSQDGFRDWTVFGAYHYGSPLDPVVFAGLGALALLVVLTFVTGAKASPERAAPDDATATM